MSNITTANIPSNLNLTTFNSLNQEYKEYILKLVAIDHLKKDCELSIKEKGFNLNQSIEEFLSFKTKGSSKTYKAYLKHFTNFLMIRNISPLRMSKNTAIQFRLYLDGLDIMHNSKNTIIATVSSYYSFLELQGFIDNNPLSKIPRFKITSKFIKEKNTLHDKDYKALLEASKNSTNKDLYHSIVLCYNLGIRIGFLKGLKVRNAEDNITLYNANKGKDYIVNISIDLYKTLKPSIDHFVENNNTSIPSLQWYLSKISKDFTHHDLRHSYSLKEYSKNKDIHRLSLLLNHTSIKTTELYLKSNKVSYLV